MRYASSSAGESREHNKPVQIRPRSTRKAGTDESMSLIEYDLFRGKTCKVRTAIERLREFEPPEGYFFANSGGKDSGVVRHLLLKAGVKFDAQYNWTTVDPPELLQHIKKQHPETVVHRPATTMWNLIVEKRMPPTRLVRYCCEVLKEGEGVGRVVVTGVRWAESYKRSKRKLVEVCFKNRGKRYLHPIIDWSTRDVWEYTRINKIPYCSLYDEGFKRLGCIGCPMSGTKGMTKEFLRWPKIKQAYLRAFERMLKNRVKDDLLTEWTSPEAVMEWWIKSARKRNKDQTVIFE